MADSERPQPNPTGETEEKGTTDRLIERGREQLDAGARRVEQWAAGNPGRRGALDLAMGLNDRDRDSLASVLGSAIAMRLFLFAVPFMLTVVGLIQILGATGLVRSAFSGARIEGAAAAEIEKAIQVSRTSGTWLFLSGLVLTMWAGRSLARVIAAASTAAWRLPGRSAKTTVRQILTTTALVSSLIVVGWVINRVHDASGPAVTSGAFLLAAATYGTLWFFVSLAMPRSTTDPGALIPGSVVFGVSLAGLSWFMHYYLPGKVARASATMGSLGVAVATLGYLFLIGRIAVGSFGLNAVVWEQHGSISSVVFDLPGVRVLPRRFPKLRDYFDLEHRPDAASDVAGNDDH